ncbi:hypothetical protein [Paenibacillus sp. JCM 10914]
MKIVRKDLSGDKLQWIWNLIFMTYMGFAASTAFNVDWANPERSAKVLDFLMVIVAPMLGFIFNRRSFHYINNDTYTRMLVFYRTIPVPAAAIFASRMILAVTAFAINSVIFFTIVYLLAPQLRSSVELTSYVAVAFSWIGIGLFLTGFYVYWENMVNGKAYLRNYTILTVIVVASCFALSLAGYSTSQFIVDAAMKWHLLSPVMWGLLILGLVFLALMCHFTYRRQQSRDLS